MLAVIDSLRLPADQCSTRWCDRPGMSLIYGMLAAILKDFNQLVLEEVPKPEPGPGEVLVRIRSCGFCATDYKAIKGGVTGMGPMEVAAGMDVVEVRKAFPRLQIIGGIDKRLVAEGKGAIDAELKRKVPPLVKDGGYIPCCDHSVPPDVSWKNFRHYRHRLMELVVPQR
jgi:hypothetical protein